MPRIVDAVLALSVTTLTIEGVACRPDGVSDFNLLRAAVARNGSRDAFLYAFDLIELDGQDLRQEPWEARRDALASLVRNAEDDPNPAVRTSQWCGSRYRIPPCVQTGAGGHCRQAPGQALSLRPDSGMGENQRSQRTGCDQNYGVVRQQRDIFQPVFFIFPP